jgi:hypothetical protein
MATSNNQSSQQPVRQTGSGEATPSTVIDVAPVTPATTPLAEVAYKAAVEALLTKPPSRWAPERAVVQPSRPVEACSRYHGKLVANVTYHPVVAAAHLAFCDHMPLVLSPDMIWLLVAQGFANHVNANAEELRPRLVSHAGKVTIRVRRDDFIKGSPENPWPEAFDEFTGQIRGHLGEATHDLLLPTFSTTGAVERAAAQVVLLDAVQSFFEYEFYSLCGIPQVVLEGTAADWGELAGRTERLGQFGLEWWTEALAPVLSEFVAAASGARPNQQFWQSIYKLKSESGGPYVTGWITAFFPYLKDRESGRACARNPWLNKEHTRCGGGLTNEYLPGGLARAPFLWSHRGLRYEMEFLGGFVGVKQEAETLRLRPEIGWAVRENAA